MGTLLTGMEIEQMLLDPEKREAWAGLFSMREYEKLPAGKHVGIVPFSVPNRGPVSYDLSIGSEVYSLRRGAKVTLDEDGTITLDPGETVLVLTQEFLAFSPVVAGITLARARLMNEGIALSSAKIDPTWFGCLQIPITNNARSPVTLAKGDRFCTLLLFKLDTAVPKEQWLNKDNTPHIGQTTLRYQPRHVTAWQPKQPDTVRDQDVDEVVAAFGPPYDVIRGGFVWNRTRVVEYMEKTWSPAVLQDLKQKIYAEEFQQMKQFRETEVALLKEQIELIKKTKADELTRSVAVLLGLIGWIAAVIALLWKTAH